MNTLYEHLREMLDAIDIQSKIPNTKIHGDAWLAIKGPICTMCAAGAWYVQKYGRRDIICLDDLSGSVERTLRVMDCLRLFIIDEAYNRLYRRNIDLRVPYPRFEGNTQTMDDKWRESMNKLLLWLTENNI